MGDNPKQNENDVEERNDEHEEPDAERRLMYIETKPAYRFSSSD
jgi:hypothetical protein